MGQIIFLLTFLFFVGCSINKEDKTKSIPFNEIKIYKFDDTQVKILEEHNKNRKQKGIGELKLDKKLCDYAQNHANFMSKNNSLNHSKMNDLKSVLNNAYVGENIAYGQQDEKHVMNSWMLSPGHRSNILNSNYSYIGIGFKEDSKNRKYWCVVFSN